MLRTVNTHADTIGKSKVEVGSINLLELNAIDGNANPYESRALPMLGSPRQLGYVSTLPIVFHKAWSNKLGDHCVPRQALQAPCTRGKQDTYVGSWYVRLHLVAACMVPKVWRPFQFPGPKYRNWVLTASCSVPAGWSGELPLSKPHMAPLPPSVVLIKEMVLPLTPVDSSNVRRLHNATPQPKAGLWSSCGKGGRCLVVISLSYPPMVHQP